jgi:DNA-binding GntR family transcriptional regulator
MDKMRTFDAPSRADWVYSNLREAIVSLAILPGEAIVEADVASRFGVSTTPVREALQRLAKDGFIVLSRYRGATVVKLDQHDVQEIYQLREVLEPLAVRLAVPQLTDADLSAMSVLLEEATHALTLDDWDQLSRLNRQFHGMFIANCGNQRLRQVLENLQEQNRIIALLTWKNRGHDLQEHQEHRAILHAVLQRDGKAAAESLRQHIVRFGSSMLSDWPGYSVQSSARMEVKQ